MYFAKGITRALKAGGGSGNIPKIIFVEYFTVEDGNENYIETCKSLDDAIDICNKNMKAKEVFHFINDELIGCVYRKI